MERSTQLQFRLQTLVEGLSVIAAAYYLVGLIAYVVKCVAAFSKGPFYELFVGAIAFPVIRAIYAYLQYLRNRVLKEASK